MWVSRFFVWFVIYAMLGWVYESAYCTCMEHRWENRGFLYGPICPIYGLGFVAMVGGWQAVTSQGIEVQPWQLFVATALGSAVLEYATSWLLERLFHARWWDYRNMPLNLNGRICLPATVLFGLMGLLVVYVLYQPTVEVTDALPPALVEALSLLLATLVAVDTTLTVSALTQFAQMAQSVSDSVNQHMDTFVSDAMERSAVAADALAQERDRFAAKARASRIGEMGAVVGSAARRIRSFAPGTEAAESPVRQLKYLWKDLRKDDA